MILAKSFAGRRVAVFGLGLSGLAAGRSLLAAGASVQAFDDSPLRFDAARAAGIPVVNLRHCDWRSFDALVLAPGVPLTHPEPHWTVRLARDHGVEIVGDTEIFVRERRLSGTNSKLVAITGTNGKSTTTALTHHLLRAAGADAALGGNIGKAVLDLPPFQDGRVYVLELSSFQLDLTPGLDADAAALLNVTPDHLDRHGTMENYASVKAKAFTHLREGGRAVIGSGDIYCDRIAGELSRRGVAVVRVSAKSPVADGIFGDGTVLYEAIGGTVGRSADLAGIGSLRGAHNLENAAASMALAGALGLPWDRRAAALPSFPGLPHRLEEVRRIGRVLFVNDSKATNADAAERALGCFSQIYWIAGGKPKAGGIASLGPSFSRIAKAYLIGEAAEPFAATLEGQIAFSVAGTLEAAVAQAAADAAARGGEAVVLLSPACASYDQFANFEARGDRFRALVLALPEPSAKGRAA